MKYRQDPDLEFLKDCSSSDLNTLVCVLLQGNAPHNAESGSPSATRNNAPKTLALQKSTSQLSDHPHYKEHAPQHELYWELIASEIQQLGANPLALMVRRGLGAHYIKILENICTLFSVKYIPDSSAEVMERELCLALFSRAITRLQDEHLPILCNAFSLLPDNLSISAFMPKIIEAMRLNDEPKYLLTMCMGHSSALHVGCTGYTDFAPEKYHAVLNLLEKPLIAELNTAPSAGRTGLQYWLLIPTVLQVAYLRAVQNIQRT